MSRTIWVGAVAYDPKVVSIWEGMRRYFHEEAQLPVEVVRAVLDGRAEAGAIGSPFWSTVSSQRLVPEGALSEVWTSPPYHHCMFTARPDLDVSLERQFAEALFGMSYDNPNHRTVLEAEGLRRWVSPQLDGYQALRDASTRQGFFERLAAHDQVRRS